MESLKKQNCRLCLSAIRGENFEEIDDSTKDILDILLLKLNLEDQSKQVVCSPCYAKLFAAVEFKSTCLGTDNTIIPYVDFENFVPVSLEEIYMKEKANSILNDQRVCRLCMHLTEDKFMPIHEVEVDMFENYVPEMNFRVTKNPVVCQPCVRSLSIHNAFLKNCMDVDKKTKNIGHSQVEKRHISGLSSDSCGKIKPESRDSEGKLTENVCTKIKWQGSKKRLLVYNYTKEEMKRRKHPCSRCPYRALDKKALKIHAVLHMDPPKAKRFTCDICTYATIYSSRLKRHIATHSATHRKEPPKIVYKKCPSCNFQTRITSVLKKHMDVHKDESEVKMYKCEYCLFKTRHPANIDSHMRKHQTTYDYRCETCPFKSKYLESYRRHLKRHKNPSEQEFLRCADCDYKTLYKHQLKVHVRKTHMNPSQAMKYECDKCQFSTFYKFDFNRHLAKHKDRSEVTMYKCDSCTYETLVKYCLKRHEIVHKDASQIEMVKCELCPYEGKHKRDLRFHMLRHVDPSKVEKFPCEICGVTFNRKYNFKTHLAKHRARSGGSTERQLLYCAECDFKTPYKSQLIFHIKRIHMDPSQVRKYKCDECSYSTVFRSALRNHTLVHKDRSEVTVFKCELCPFETLFKSHFKKHGVVHKDASEVVVFKCEVCPYETRFSSSLRAHMVRHTDPPQVDRFRCGLCENSYKRKSSLRVHMAKHHNRRKVRK